MKKVTLVFAILLIAIFAKAQDKKYQKAMGQAMQAWAKAEGPADYTEVVNAFSRIAAGQDTSYLPDYYAAYVQIIESFYLTDAATRDKLLDEAQKHIKRASKISPNNDEIEVMNGYALMARMVIDPANRAQKYSPRAMQSYGKARMMNPTNPRAVIMMARMKLGTAQFFGSSIDAACRLAHEGKALLEKETANGFQPHWGKHEVNAVLKNCD